MFLATSEFSGSVEATTRSDTPLKGHRTALTLLVLAYTLSMCDRMILSILFPDIKTEFGLTDTQLGLLGGLSFALFYATMGLPIAKLSDQYNRKWIIIISLTVFSLMTALSGFAAGFISLLLLRIGVGIGEAGVNPASHSIIADYFPPQRRAFAMATLMLGASLGMMLGFMGGGAIADAYGWRVALISVGLPGFFLATVMGAALQEPRRGRYEEAQPPPPPPIAHTAATMWANRAMRHLLAGSVIAGLVGYGLTQWLPTFFMRTHDLTQTQTGLLMAGVFGISGAIGALAAGKWFDRLSIRGFQYGMWMLAAVPFVTLPLFILGLQAQDLTTAIALFIIPGFAANYAIGPTIAMIQTLSPPHMRAVSAAIKMLLLNLIGMGLGPLLVGIISDLLASTHPENTLGVALSYFTIVGLWGSVHFWLCGRELARANQG